MLLKYNRPKSRCDASLKTLAVRQSVYWRWVSWSWSHSLPWYIWNRPGVIERNTWTVLDRANLRNKKRSSPPHPSSRRPSKPLTERKSSRCRHAIPKPLSRQNPLSLLIIRLIRFESSVLSLLLLSSVSFSASPMLECLFDNSDGL